LLLFSVLLLLLSLSLSVLVSYYVIQLLSGKCAIKLSVKAFSTSHLTDTDKTKHCYDREQLQKI